MGSSIREVRAVAFGFSVLVAYTAIVLASGLVDLAEYGRFLFSYLKGSFALWIVVGMVLVPVLLYQRRPPIGPDSPLTALVDWGRERWERDRYLSLVWPPLMFALLMTSFNSFKQLVLPGAGFVFDPAFAAIDRAIFLGHDPWTLTHAIFSAPWASYLLDRAYHAWFLPVSLVIPLCAFLSVATWQLRTQYLLSYMAVWILLGSLFAYALPAAGPCFHSALIGPSPSFDVLLAQLRAHQAVMLAGSPLDGFFALQHQAYLLDVQSRPVLSVGGGISAMPSVHNALAVLFALGAFRVNRLLGWAAVAYAAIIWIGSVHLGWHYAIDGIVSAGLTLGIWRTAARITGWLERPARSAPALPANLA